MIEKKVLAPDQFVEFQTQIGQLYEICFSSKLNPLLWEWAYLKNPTGEPIIAVALEDGNLIAHYAMIPLPFEQDIRMLQGYLSMTTMVHPNFRKYGLFVELANMTYSQANKNSFVYGFPNANSLPGFKKRLEWKVSSEYFIASIGEHLLPMYQNSLELRKSREIKFDVSNPEFLAWRLSKPGSTYKSQNSLIYKEYKGTIDLMHIEKGSLPFFYKSEKLFNILTDDESLINASDSVQPYHFGVRSFGSQINIDSFTPTLIMSDVF